MAIYLQEFLYRGRDPVNEPNLEPGYSVRLAQFTPSPFGGDPFQVLSDPMGSAAADALGFSLPTILSTIDATTAAHAEALEAQVAQLQTDNDALKVTAQSLSAENKHLSTDNDTLTSQVTVLIRERTDLQAQVDDLTQRIKDLEAQLPDPVP